MRVISSIKNIKREREREREEFDEHNFLILHCGLGLEEEMDRIWSSMS